MYDNSRFGISQCTTTLNIVCARLNCVFSRSYSTFTVAIPTPLHRCQNHNDVYSGRTKVGVGLYPCQVYEYYSKFYFCDITVALRLQRSKNNYERTVVLLCHIINKENDIVEEYEHRIYLYLIVVT